MFGDRFSSSTSCSRWVHETEPDRPDQSLTCCFLKVATHPYENCWITKEGDRRLVAWCNSTVPDDEGKVEYVIRTGVDITERKEAEDKIRFLAYYDELTGLANRALFMEHLNQAIANSERHRRLLAVVFLDIDRFKNINDNSGSPCG